MGILRLGLALAVLLGHLPLATFQFINGGAAVQGFYIVSGFYMALVLEGKYRDVTLFYTNRLLRLFPSYAVMSAIAAIVLWGLNASATASPEIFTRAFSNPVTALALLFENIFIVGQEMLFWFTIGPDGALSFDTTGALPSDDTTLAWQAVLVPQAWSLSIELMFYACAPFLARLHWGWLALAALASLALRLAGAHIEGVNYGIWQGRLFPTALFLFLFGMLAHRALPLVARLPRALGWVAQIMIVAMIVALPLTQIPPPAQRWVMYAVIAVAAPFLFNTFRNAAIDRWIGDLSFPLYLCHLAVIGLVLTFNPPFALWIAIGGSLAMAAALLMLVDRPIDKWRQSRLAPPSP